MGGVGKNTKKLPKCIRQEEFPLLIKVIPKEDVISRIAFLLAYGSGMRISEVLNCTPQDFRRNSIFINDSKYGRDRVVPIPKGWKDNFFKNLPIKLTDRTLERRFNKYRDRAKLSKEYTFHSLRHGFATRCLENGIPLNQISGLLGHSNISTTSIYTKANPIDSIKSYEELF